MVLADTHCHLNFNLFQEDLARVLENAWQGGLRRILIPGVDLDTSRKAVALSARYTQLYAAVGVHPNDAQTWDEHSLAELKELAQHPKVVAIGEIGLDYYRDLVPGPLQQSVLEAQLALAAELQLPVVIHSRHSIGDVWPRLSAWHQTLVEAGSPLQHYPGVLHSFEDDIQTAKEAIQRNFFIGVTGPVTFHNAHQRQQLVAALPLESILLETDAPFLAPHPFRGKRNEPAYLPLIAEKVAELQQKPVPVVAEATYNNSTTLFSWGS